MERHDLRLRAFDCDCDLHIGVSSFDNPSYQIRQNPQHLISHFLQYRGGTNAGRIASRSTLNPGPNTRRDEQDIHTHYMGYVFVSRWAKTLQNGQRILNYVTKSMGKKRPAFQIRQLGLVTLGAKRDMKKRPYEGVLWGRANASSRA
jgi:hypothetical protein